MFKKLLLTIIFIYPEFASAQYADGYLRNAVPANGQVQCFSLINDGNYSTVMCGIFPMFLARFDPSLNVSWSYTYTTQSGSYCIPAQVIETLDHKYIIVGYVVISTNPYKEDAQVFKVDEMGNLEWACSFDGAYNDRFRTVLETTDSCFVFSGYTQYPGYQKPFMVKVDKNGNIIWSKMITTGSSETSNSVACTDGGYVILNTNGNGEIIKYNNNDNIVWATRFNVYPFYYLNLEGIIETRDHGFMLTGSYMNGLDSVDGLFIKIDSIGTIQWYTVVDFEQLDALVRVTQTRDNGFVAVGGTDMTGFNPSRAIICKLDQNGNFLWGSLCADSCYFNSVFETQNGLFAAGDSRTFEYGPNGLNVYMANFDSLGNKCSGVISAGDTASGFISAYSFTPIETPLNLTITNNSTQNQFPLEFIETCNVSTVLPEIWMNECTPIPNPTSGKIVYKGLQGTNNLTLMIYNPIGIQIQSIKIPSGQHEIQIDITAFPKSLYFFRLSDGTNSSTKKVIKN